MTATDAATTSFVVLSRYVAALDVIDAALPAHVAWLEECYARGMFLVSGRQRPRHGGIIVTRPCSRADLDVALAADPFAECGLIEVTVVAFEALFRHRSIAS